MNPPGAAQLLNDAGQPAVEKERTPTSPEAGSALAKAPSVPDYELLRRIGGGAYGEVWLARSKATGALRAAKIVWRARFEDERPYRREFEGIQRFEQISREHPSQLALFHIGRNDAEGYFYYVMELADDLNAKSAGVGNPKPEIRSPKEVRNPKPETSATGGKGRPSDSVPASACGIQDSDSYVPHILRADLANGALPAARVLEIALALSEALGHLHQRGLVHRDVKPSNVIFVNGRPKLADIGLVTDASDQCSIVGTEGYLPPEGPGTPQSDIFALGKVLYEAATGLDRRSFPELPEDLRDWPEHQTVVELNEIVLRSCAKEAANRYSSCQDMHDDLARLQQGRSVKDRRIMHQRLRLMRKFGVTAIAAALAIAGAVFLWRMLTGYEGRVVVMGDGTEALGNYNIKAAEAYKLGLSALRRGTPNDFPQAVTNFNRAIEIEPRFVAAYARLFETYLMGDDHGFPIAGATDKLNELSARLQQLAPTNADTHAAVAIVKFMNQWQWKEAEKEFKEALKTGPNCRMALTYYGYFLTRLGRATDARLVLDRADKVDPGSADIAKLLGHCAYAQRDYDEALNCYQTAEERNPSYPSAYYWDARANMGQGNYPQAIRQLIQNETFTVQDKAWLVQRYDNLRKAIQQDPEHPAYAYWTALIEDLKQLGSTNSMPYLWAARYVRVGQKDKAENWLRRALQERDPGMEYLLFDECWDPYRRETWLKDVLKEVGLDPLR